MHLKLKSILTSYWKQTTEHTTVLHLNNETNSLIQDGNCL